jgi:hypothetical protein
MVKVKYLWYGIPIFKIRTVPLFLVLKNRTTKYLLLKDDLLVYISGLIKYLFCWLKLKSVN